VPRKKKLYFRPPIPGNRTAQEQAGRRGHAPHPERAAALSAPSRSAPAPNGGVSGAEAVSGAGRGRGRVYKNGDGGFAPGSSRRRLRWQRSPRWRRWRRCSPRGPRSGVRAVRRRAAAALRPRPEPDLGERGPERPRGPRTGHGEWAPRSVRRLRLAALPTGRQPPLTALPLSAPTAGSPSRPPPAHGPPPGPCVPSPAGGARTEDGAEENSRTSGLSPFVQGEGWLGLGALQARPPE
jgi:hypothetical protein